MWLDLIRTLDKNCKTHPPLSDEWIHKGLADLDVTLNASLKSFLQATDGLYDYKQFLWMVWNVRDLLAYNLAMREDEKFAKMGYKFDDIFFISNSGKDGILFGFPIADGILQEFIIAWYPETNERVQIAENLEHYLEEWLQGNLNK